MALSPITTTRALTIPLSVSFFCCLSKMVCLKSLSVGQDETLIILRGLLFLRANRTTLLSWTILGITALVDLSIPIKYVFTHIYVHLHVAVASC